ncbi:AI-2E family transporter [Pontibacter chinhatensis]|uniref:Predicted PurR-regulated permease PerM n=1 Tax=Pontibacter chinhatensis TaxID=1436961 RepID=A0A1I2NYA7_9BACT|nr:AI-2E family transporter [Pontibacter chinhatensis]SFG07789.1 Predicted PurR-regulated permease PerM [Pontibacter chinhatensis]
MLNVYLYAKRVAIAALVVLLIGTGFYLMGRHAYFFLLVFAAILLAVLFCGMTDWIVDKLHLKRGWSLLLAVLLFFGLIIGAFWLIAPTVSEQVQEMQQTIPKALTRVQDWLSQYGWGQKLVEQVPDDMSKAMPEQDALLSKVSGVFSSALSFLADFLIVIITALFLASNPSLYTVGFTKLFPVRNRSRVMEVLGKSYATLKSWLVGMLSAMAIIGVSSAIGYSLIGLPLALALALIAFFLAFIPNVGPWIAGVPAVLVGLTEGPQMALYVVLVYGGIQMVESYLITPIIFQKTVDMPPALLLFFQVLLGILQGALGLLLAAPILAVLMVWIQEFYIRDVLEAEPLDAAEEHAVDSV